MKCEDCEHLEYIGNESYETSYPVGYLCNERELDNDKRFPYKNTKCKKFREVVYVSE